MQRLNDCKLFQSTEVKDFSEQTTTSAAYNIGTPHQAHKS